MALARVRAVCYYASEYVCRRFLMIGQETDSKKYSHNGAIIENKIDFVRSDENRIRNCYCIFSKSP